MKGRWQATICYRAKNGPIEIVYDLEEIEDLGFHVEAGPHWGTIEKIEIIRINHNTSETLTVEQAENM